MATRGNSETRLVTYPECAQYVPVTEKQDSCIEFIQGDIPQKMKNPDLNLGNRICDYGLLSCPAPRSKVINAIFNTASCTEILGKAKRNARFFNLAKTGSGTITKNKYKAIISN